MLGLRAYGAVQVLVSTAAENPKEGAEVDGSAGLGHGSTVRPGCLHLSLKPCSLHVKP